jgi:hypothetical protein
MKTLALLIFVIAAAAAADGTGGYGETEIHGAAADTGIRLKVTVLASEITLGKDGETMPVIVDFSGEGGGYRPLHDGKAAVVGASRVVAVDHGVDDLRFLVSTIARVRAAPGEFAVVLGDGADLAQVMAAHRIHPPIGSQRSIAAILGDLLHDGRLGLKADQRVVLVELGVERLDDPATAEFADFQDLVLLIGPAVGGEDF